METPTGASAPGERVYVQFNVRIDRELLRSMKHRALDERATLAEVVDRVFRAWLARPRLR